jgi:Cu-processing system permease protein
MAIFTWLFFTIIYDGLFLLILLFFKDYPLENTTLALTFLNPVDLSRILIIMKLEISAMMGYTGAVLQNFLGSSMGALMICFVLLLWLVVPFFFYLRSANKKDF